jgi:prevent-host-death family protein
MEDNMKFIGVRDFRNKSSKIWDELNKEKEIIITSNGKPVAILSAVSEGNLEEKLSAFRRARAISAVTALQRNSVQMGTDGISTEDINSEIKAERNKRSG